MGMAGRDIVADVGNIALASGQRANLNTLLTRLNPARGAHDKTVLYAQQAQGVRRGGFAFARGHRHARRTRRGCASATGRVRVVDGIVHRGPHIRRTTDGDKQHQHGLGALGGHEFCRLGQAIERVAIEIRVLVALFERAYHRFTCRTAHHIDHSRGVHGIALAQGQLRHNTRSRGTVFGKVALLKRADRRANDKAGNPRAIGGSALRAAAVGERTGRKHQAAQLDMAQMRRALKDVKHGPAWGELNLRCHDLGLLGRRNRTGRYFDRSAKSTGSCGSTGKRSRHLGFCASWCRNGKFKGKAHRKQKPRKRIGCNQSGNKAAHHGALGKYATCSHNQHRNLAGRKRKHTLQEPRAPIARKCPRGNAGYAGQRQRQCGNNTR